MKQRQKEAQEKKRHTLNVLLHDGKRETLTIEDCKTTGYDQSAINAKAAYSRDEHDNPLPRLMEGIRFHRSKDKDDLCIRIVRELEEQRHRARNSVQMQADETERRLHREIGRLKEALELEQRRHFADICKFASGARTEADYRPALAV